MRYAYYALFFLLLLPATALAQATGSISGQVTEERTGETMPGVNVIITSLNRGAATDIDGNYVITELPPGTYEVVARFIGFKDNRQTVTVSPGRETAQNFSMAEDLLLLDEVVVTGQAASTEKRKLSANVDVLNIRDIEEAPVVSVDQLLQGRVTGSTVRMQSAQPGQGALINFRGITSVFASQTPVIYIDGVRVDNNSSTSYSNGGETTSALSELLTSDIERIEVTKGGAASTLYGSDAANGVIQIFTKRGIAGKTRVTVRTEQGVDTPDLKFVQDTGFSFPCLNPANEGNTDACPELDRNSPDFGETSYIEDNFLKNGHFQNYYVGVSGGSEALTFNVSGRIQNGDGIQPSNENTLYALRGNLQSQLTDVLSVGFSGSYTRSNFKRLNNGTAIADPYTSFQVGDAYFFTGADNFDEALRRFLLPIIEEGVDRFTFSSQARYNPSPLFSSSLTVGLDSRVNEQRSFDPIEFDVVSGRDSGGLDRFDRNFLAVTLEYVGTIRYPREGNITSDFTFGAQGFREQTSIITANVETFALPGTEDISQAGEKDVNEAREQIFNGGIFFREQIGLLDRVFINAGLRLDGNSSFGGDTGLQTYPSLGIAYTISDESFWPQAFGNAWNDLKLRLAYGVTGKFPGAFDRDFTFDGAQFRGESAAFFDNPGNSNLKPERTSTIEGGIETSLLDRRLAVNFTYYTATTKDALFFVPEQPSSGQGTQLRNIGEIKNRGIELSANASVINTRNVSWSLGFNYSWFENEITDIGGVADFNVGGSSVRAQQRVAGPDPETGETHPIGEWRAMTPFDSNGDGLLDDSKFEFTGDTPYPTQTGAFNTSLTLFRNLTFFALADFALGAKIFDWSSHWASFNGLPRTVLPDRFDLDGNPDGTFSTTSGGVFLLKDGDYLKLRELSVRYALPRTFVQRLSLERASVFGTVRNLYTFSRQDLLDPEITGVSSNSTASQGVDGLELGGEQSSTLSPPRQFRLGLEIVF